MLTALLAAALLAPAPAPAGTVLNRVAAVVNGEVVTLKELRDRAAPELRALDARTAGPEREQVRAQLLKQVLEAVVAERLLDAQVKDLQAEATEAEIDEAIDGIKKRERIDDASLDRALAEQGLDRAAFRKQTKRSLEARNVLRLRVGSKIRVTDEDVRNHYQQHQKEYLSGVELRVRHVFLQLPAGAPAAEEARVRTRAEQLVARLRAGADFARLAREVSQGPSAADGGDLGWLARGVVQPEVERAAYGLRDGEVSDPVRTRNGFQILKVEARRGGAVRPFDEVKELIRDRLTNDQVDSYTHQYVAELRRDAVVDVRLPGLAN
ncbi:MAG TPA: peptidylprolyl isomerase [Anaeromyxobacteraceae bacterium]|jgi:peptidyl-prolyl cis-trans isomerase SurA